MSTTPMATKRRRPRFFMDCWNTFADPSELVVIVAGSTRSATALTCAVAWPSETPGFNQNDTETDGSWPEWLMDWGPTEFLYFTTVSSGTTVPDDVLKATFLSASARD